ncbi:MAG: alpha/beta fold hydrolase, partial [Pseudomonadota bacterium]
MLALVALACVVVLEWRFAGLDVEEISVAGTPVTIYSQPSADPKAPVIVAHGFAGSRQMMDQIALSLARQGFLVASVDLPGHGRNRQPLLPDVTRIEGTTAQLVDAVARVADALVAREDTRGPVSYVGHSMATDVVIRAARLREDVGGVVAISMYSTDVSADHPQRLLVLSGATETRLRAVGVEAVQQIDPRAQEGETVSQGDIQRRTASAPLVGHVGVLYAPQTLEELTRWLRDATASGTPARLDTSGWVAGVLFACLVAFVWPFSKLIPERAGAAREPVPPKVFLTCLIAPIPVVLLIAALPVSGVAGFAAFASLAAILAGWGVVQLAIFWRAGIRIGKPDLAGTLIY